MKKQTSNQDEARYQERLNAVKNIVARYVALKDLDAFFAQNATAIDGLARGRAVSDVMSGFQKTGKPEETYEARLEVFYAKKDNGEMFLKPRLHFKQAELRIAPTLTLSTALQTELPLQPSDVANNKMDIDVMVGKEKISLQLSEGDLMKLRRFGEMDKNIPGKEGYEYAVKADVKNNLIRKLTFTQKTKVALEPHEVDMLKSTGRIDRTLKAGEGVNERQYFVAVDKELNKLAFAPISALTLRGEIKGSKLSHQNNLDLMEGRKTLIKIPIKGAEGAPALKDVYIHFDPVLKNIRFENAVASEQAMKNIQKTKLSPALEQALKLNIPKENTAPQHKQQQGFKS